MLSESVLILNLLSIDIDLFEEWLDDKRWRNNVGFNKYSVEKENYFIIEISSDLSHTWRNEVLPSIAEYWNLAGKTILYSED